MQDYLSSLNKAQLEAVTNYNGASLVIAGAGSGKTRVLTYRIAYLLEAGVSVYQILALTFTNKAAREMKERIAALVGDETTRHLWMGTFHSMFARILRFESEKLNYPADFSIYDTVDSKNLLKTIIKELNLDPQIYKPNEVLGAISGAKNNLITAKQYSDNPYYIEKDTSSGKPHIAKIYRIYSNRCRKAGAMDFDDILVNINLLFYDHPEVLKKYQDKFLYLLVDEYQDTNYSQYMVIKQLSAKHGNLCVVGDDAQSIYSFRGAKIENILNFRNDNKGCSIYKLEQNYRSTQTIVSAANSLIAKNKNRIQKTVWSGNESGNLIRVSKALTDNEEGFIVANEILDSCLRDHYSYQDFAILYRTNAQSRIFEESLRKKNIPYKIYGGLAFYQRKEIKDMVAYFRLAINHNDDESLKRIINYPVRGLGKTSIEKLEMIAQNANITMWAALVSIDNFKAMFNSGIITKFSRFKELIEGFTALLPSKEAYDMALHIATNSGILKDLYTENTPESLGRYENIQELLNGIREFSVNASQYEDKIITLNEYVANVSLLTNEEKETDEDKNRVSLMTVHSAKGLEYNNVFIVGVEKELFPSAFSSGSLKEIEEERRLFYVALTRAKKNVHITYASSRYRWGNPTTCSPSIFIQEIDSDYIEGPIVTNTSYTPDYEQYSSKTHYGKEPAYRKPVPSGSLTISTTGRKQLKPMRQTNETLRNDQQVDLQKLTVGVQVEHTRFGAGKVLQVEGSPPDVMATIFFQNAGQKQILLKFAKLKII